MLISLIKIKDIVEMCSKLKIKNLLFKSESVDNHAISEIQLKNQ